MTSSLIGKHFKATSGELFTVKEIENGRVHLQAYDLPYELVGELARFDEWRECVQAKELNALEYEVELADVKNNNYSLREEMKNEYREKH